MTTPANKAQHKQTSGQNTSSNNGLDDSLLDNHGLNLPKDVIRRVNALKNIQERMVDIETKFYDDLHHLECKYASMYEPLLNAREKIVSGEHEPTDAEAKWTMDDLTGQSATDLATDLKNKMKLENGTAESNTANPTTGIPEFWLTAMKNTDIIGETVQEHDEQILKHLKDIRVRLHDAKPYGYTLEFYFNDNEFFTNKVLTKTYELTTDKDVRDPLGYDGPSLYRSVGCTIDWVKGKDVTVRLVKKKQKHKSSGTIRVVTKEEKQDSFFNFFESPSEDGYRPSYKALLKNNGKTLSEEDEEEIDEETEDLFEADFEIGHFFKEFLIPKAVLYFTGELIDENEDYDDEGEEDDEDLKVSLLLSL
jgi:nucleosome assembly protein 1-like 1